LKVVRISPSTHFHVGLHVQDKPDWPSHFTSSHASGSGQVIGVKNLATIPSANATVLHIDQVLVNAQGPGAGQLCTIQVLSGTIDIIL